MIKDEYLMEMASYDDQEACGFLCQFSLTLPTKEEFMNTVAPFIDTELSRGRCILLDDGRYYFAFILDKDKGEIFMKQFSIDGRFLTEAEFADLDRKEISGTPLVYPYI